MNNRAIIVFAKKPVSGKVKTRLAASIGDQAALNVYLFLTRYTRGILSPLEAQVFVFYTDEIMHNDGWEVLNAEKRLQTGIGLGERMMQAFQEVFDLDYKQVLLVGTDIYQQTTDNLEIAFDKLNTFDVVANPVKDGGYCLIGLNEGFPELFKNRNWSHPMVYQELLETVRLHHKSLFALPEIIDIDNLNDLVDSGLDPAGFRDRDQTMLKVK